MNKYCRIFGHRYWIGGTDKYFVIPLFKWVDIWYERCTRCNNYKIQDLKGKILQDLSRGININERTTT